MITKQDFYDYVLGSLLEIRAELDQRRAGVAGTGSVEELEQSAGELADLIARLESDKLPPVSERSLVSAWFALHSWPAEDLLGERICRISQIYKHLLDEEADMGGAVVDHKVPGGRATTSKEGASERGTAAIQGKKASAS